MKGKHAIIEADVLNFSPLLLEKTGNVEKMEGLYREI